MATIINNPPSSDNSGGGMGMVVGLVLLVVVVILFFVYGLPALQQTQVQVPAPQINVPSEIDVNVKQAE